jgi:serine/threonine protein kinase
MTGCYKLRKNDCLLSDSCEWIVGKGCTKKSSRSNNSKSKRITRKNKNRRTNRRTKRRTNRRTRTRTRRSRRAVNRSSARKNSARKSSKSTARKKKNPYDKRLSYSPEDSVIDELTLIKKLGMGGQAAVYKINTKNSDVYAMKLGQKIDYNSPSYIKLPHKYRRFFDLYGMRQEYTVLSELKKCEDNVYLPKIYQASFDKDKKYFYYVIEYFPKGSLESYAGKLSKETIFGIVARLIVCLMAIHKCGYVHLDIKPANIMVHNDPVVGVCLVDYGIATKINNNYGPRNPKSKSSFTGTLDYMTTNYIQGNHIDEKDDYEQLAVTTIKLFLGKLPWMGKPYNEVMKIIKDKDFPKKMSSLCKVPFLEKFLTSIRNLKVNPYVKYNENRIYKPEQYEKLLELVLEEGAPLDEPLII